MTDAERKQLAEWRLHADYYSSGGSDFTWLYDLAERQDGEIVTLNKNAQASLEGLYGHILALKEQSNKRLEDWRAEHEEVKRLRAAIAVKDAALAPFADLDYSNVNRDVLAIVSPTVCRRAAEARKVQA